MSEEQNFLSDIVDQLNNQEPLVKNETEEQAQEEAPKEQETVQEEPKAEEQPETQVQENQEPVAQEAEDTPWWDKSSDNSSEKSSETKQQEVTEEKAVKEDAFIDDDIKLIMDYKKSGKTLADFVKEYKVEDYSSWDDAKIVKEGLKEFMSLEKEELEQAVYEFENASVFQKKQWADSFKEKFAKKNDEMLKQLSSSNAQMEQQATAIANKFKEDLNSYASQVVDKEIYGLKVTDEMSNGLKDFIDNEFTFNKADGSLDVEKIFSVALWMKHGADLVKANVTKAKNEGKEQVIKEVSNPSKNYTNVGKSVGSGIDAAQQAFDQLFQLNNN